MTSGGRRIRRGRSFFLFQQFAVAFHTDAQPAAVQLDQVAPEFLQIGGVEPSQNVALHLLESRLQSGFGGEDLGTGTHGVEDRREYPIEVATAFVPIDRLFYLFEIVDAEGMATGNIFIDQLGHVGRDEFRAGENLGQCEVAKRVFGTGAIDASNLFDQHFRIGGVARHVAEIVGPQRCHGLGIALHECPGIAVAFRPIVGCFDQLLRQHQRLPAPCPVPSQTVSREETERHRPPGHECVATDPKVVGSGAEQEQDGDEEQERHDADP